MGNVDDRAEAVRRMNQKRMTKEELSTMAAMLRLAADSFSEARKYESASRHHPVALKCEEIGEAQLDEAILFFARIRSRADDVPTMRADGTIQ